MSNNEKGTRTLHFDEPHTNADYYHINADIGPLSKVEMPDPGHIRISKGLYDAINEGSVTKIGNIAAGLGVVIDIYSVVSAPPGQRLHAAGEAGSGWAGAWIGAEIGSGIWPGPGSVLGGIFGCVAGSVGFNFVTSDSGSDPGYPTPNSEPIGHHDF